MQNDRVVHHSFKPPGAVGEFRQNLRAVKGRFAHVAGGFGIGKFNFEPDAAAVTVIKVAVPDIAFQRKVFGALGRKIEHLGVRYAVQCQVPDVVVILKAADKVEPLLLLHKSQGRNFGLGLLPFRFSNEIFNFASR